MQAELDAWRDVEGVSVEAMTEWIAYLADCEPPKDLRPHARIALAKTLAGMGSSDVQLAAVRFCEKEGWRSLRHADGKAANRSSSFDRKLAALGEGILR